LKNIIDLDALILGGGIAGLWLARRLQLAGYRVVLLENQKLGGGQTLASQGIIHGGLKYALLGQVNETARRIAEVSREWIAAIEGRGTIDLRGTKIFTKAQHMLMPGGLLGNLAGAMGHAVFGDIIQILEKDEWPAAVKDLGFSGQVIDMSEPGIDVRSALEILAAQLKGVCYHYDADDLNFHDDEVHVGDVQFRARKIISVAAEGNDWLANKLGIKALSQRRPLKQVLIKGDLPHAFLHGAAINPKPAFTITTHYTKTGETVWYIGGGVAEDGVKQDDAQLFKNTAHILQKYLPNLNLENKQWASLSIDRVEGLDAAGHLPERPSYQYHKNVTLAWVNKLTFAPLLADELLAQMHSDKIGGDLPELSLPPAEISETPWDKITWQTR